jgi:hypothetical protein
LDLDQAKDNTDLIPNQFLKQGMPRNREDKAWEEHPQRYHDCACKCLSQAPIDQPALKTHERGEYYQRCGQYVPDGDAVDKNFLGEPAALEDGLDLDKRYSRVRPSEGQASSDEAKDEEVDERWGLCDAEGERDGGGHAAEDNVYGVAGILGEKEDAGRDPEAAGDEGVEDAV